MQYFYSPDGTETLGPISEDVLRNLYFQRRITLDTAVTQEGQTDWYSTRAYFPDLEFYRGCPKCHQKCSLDQKVCPACKFSVDAFLDNCSRAAKTPGKSLAHDETAIQAQINTLQQTFWGCAIVSCVVFALIALAIAPLLALVVVIGGIGGIIQIQTDRAGKAKVRQQAIQSLSRAFTGVCPHCNKMFHRLDFSMFGAVCPSCKKLLQEQGATIYWVPNFAVRLSPDNKHFFQFDRTA